MSSGSRIWILEENEADNSKWKRKEKKVPCVEHLPAIHWTAYYESHSVELAKILIDAGADILKQDSSGDTALHLAVSSNNFEMVDLLLKHDADVNSIDRYNQTILN